MDVLGAKKVNVFAQRKCHAIIFVHAPLLFQAILANRRVMHQRRKDYALRRCECIAITVHFEDLELAPLLLTCQQVHF
jgi:hypothetical protein